MVGVAFVTIIALADGGVVLFACDGAVLDVSQNSAGKETLSTLAGIAPHGRFFSTGSILSMSCLQCTRVVFDKLRA